MAEGGRRIVEVGPGHFVVGYDVVDGLAGEPEGDCDNLRGIDPASLGQRFLGVLGNGDDSVGAGKAPLVRRCPERPLEQREILREEQMLHVRHGQHDWNRHPLRKDGLQGKKGHVRLDLIESLFRETGPVGREGLKDPGS